MKPDIELRLAQLLKELSNREENFLFFFKEKGDDLLIIIKYWLAFELIDTVERIWERPINGTDYKNDGELVCFYIRDYKNG